MNYLLLKNISGTKWINKLQTKNVTTPVNTKNCEDDTIFVESVVRVAKSGCWLFALELQEFVILYLVFVRLYLIILIFD